MLGFQSDKSITMRFFYVLQLCALIVGFGAAIATPSVIALRSEISISIKRRSENGKAREQGYPLHTDKSSFR